MLRNLGIHNIKIVCCNCINISLILPIENSINTLGLTINKIIKFHIDGKKPLSQSNSGILVREK